MMQELPTATAVSQQACLATQPVLKDMPQPALNINVIGNVYDSISLKTQLTLRRGLHLLHSYTIGCAAHAAAVCAWRQHTW
jgi:hypothetical protein